MAKLTVKNVGPIREAELDVKKHTVFIGPQGSGKSTLAKLIAICSDTGLLPSSFSTPESLPFNYNIENYFVNDTVLDYRDDFYVVNYEKSFDFNLTKISQQLLDEQLKKHRAVFGHGHLLDFTYYKQHFIPKNKELMKEGRSLSNSGSINLSFYGTFFKNHVLNDSGIYIPSERSLFPILSNAVWSLLNTKVTLPNTLTFFGAQFEQARNTRNRIDIQFLQIQYKRTNGQDYVEYKPGQFINLSQSASGYQSIIPLLLVVEHQRQQSRRRFIIEEPELNLYPTAQKDLIYALMSGLDPNVEYQDAEWVITTHSPYVLSSFNTLMLAYKVAHKSDELRAEVEKIIPARCWINPDEFAAYYVDNGTVRSIISEKTGLIADNELDDVSEDLAGEQDQLFELSRSVPRA